MCSGDALRGTGLPRTGVPGAESTLDKESRDEEREPKDRVLASSSICRNIECIEFYLQYCLHNLTEIYTANLFRFCSSCSPFTDFRGRTIQYNSRYSIITYFVFSFFWQT